MLEATSTEKVIREKSIEEVTTSDFSPSSDGVTDCSIEESPEEEEAEDTNHSDDEGIDGDSLDEGVGDSSSESETAESPVPNNDNQHLSPTPSSRLSPSIPSSSLWLVSSASSSSGLSSIEQSVTPSELGEKSLVVTSSIDFSRITFSVDVASSISALTEKKDLFLDCESLL
jgi:hypothetical protein